MSNLESRLQAAERALAARMRQRAERNEMCGAIPFIVKDGHITSCLFLPCDRIPTMQEFSSLGRNKATCPDVLTCAYSDVCKSGEPMLENVSTTSAQ